MNWTSILTNQRTKISSPSLHVYGLSDSTNNNYDKTRDKSEFQISWDVEKNIIINFK